MSSDRSREALKRGLSLAKAGHHGEAIAVLKKSLADSLANADSAWASRLAKNIGIICEHNGLLDEAVNSYQVALEQDPRDGSVAYLMALLYEKTGKLEDARQAEMQARRLAWEKGDDELVSACDALLARMRAAPS